ncbi:uncharacterized protein Z518_03113 [Rhinocladiella mackenziei CBS 650.93]|uniref:G-patch domain-containing protein n=1 Tax=Rhinocladiella mackenziei CBS 650.93 TaxID=1442369 RepID=A0A0D2G1T5_9EURO|nr:uncharacterized protein Z518_03113 [Rhinocladiella mackenziei CBS 650.93]KIX08457.1 hypothetical protein Z518_03113 [Rhinocladiella mackenziei CBS 650.93]
MVDTGEDYFLPVEGQRVFGAGIKHKRIAFVPASAESSTSTTTAPTSTNAGSHYLSIVLPKETEEAAKRSKIDSEEKSIEIGAETCAVCKQPISSTNDKVAINSHESSIAHQVCLEHSHPPSHLDRNHVGVKYLTTYGWDPNSRKGLGARQEGIRIPIKAKEKHDTVGLRETGEDDDKHATKRKKNVPAKKEDKIVKLNAKQVRIQEMETKKRTEKLRQSFYGPDLEKYLGPNG